MIACFSIQKDTIFITHHSVSAPHLARCFVDTCIARRQDGGQIPRCQQHKRAFSGRKWCKSASDFTSSIIHYHIIILSRKFILRCSSQSTTFSIRHPFSESSDPRDMMSYPPFPSPCVSSQRIPVPMWVSTSPLAGMHMRCTYVPSPCTLPNLFISLLDITLTACSLNVHACILSIVGDLNELSGSCIISGRTISSLVMFFVPETPLFGNEHLTPIPAPC